MARRLCAAGRIRVGLVYARVGLVYARVRQTELPSGCYRCLAFGHIVRERTGPDRSDACWRCGVAGHRGRNCAAPPEVQAPFRAAEKGNGGRSLPQRDPPPAKANGEHEDEQEREDSGRSTNRLVRDD